MMKTSYEDFILSDNTCGDLKDNKYAKELFYIISKDENIFRMIDFSRRQKPALEACIEEIDLWYSNLQIQLIDLNSNKIRQRVGKMVKAVLAPFGYEPVKNEDFSNIDYVSKYFESASYYKNTGNATMMIEVVAKKI